MARYILKKKQSKSVTHEDWLYAVEHIEELVSKAEVDALADRTITDIRSAIGRGAAAGYGWSSGKDSLAVQWLLEQGGFDLPSVLGRTNLEYPAFLPWLDEFRPKGLQVYNTGQDLDWLVKHPDMLFPQTGNQSMKFFAVTHHVAQRKFFKDNGLRVILFGRRYADGNYIGEGGFHTNRFGMTVYCPIRFWEHEDVLALIHYYKIPLPPFYSWPRGYRVGTGPWSKRRVYGGVMQGWKEIYSIDRSIVIGAAEKIASAREFLDSLKEG